MPIEDHFYINSEKILYKYVAKPESCFDPFTVLAGQTLDLSANVSIRGITIPNNAKRNYGYVEL